MYSDGYTTEEGCLQWHGLDDWIPGTAAGQQAC